MRKIGQLYSELANLNGRARDRVMTSLPPLGGERRGESAGAHIFVNAVISKPVGREHPCTGMGKLWVPHLIQKLSISYNLPLTATLSLW